MSPQLENVALPMITITSWPYQRTDNRYIHQLYASLDVVVDQPISVTDYRPGRVWKPAPDYLHLHWPETALDHRMYVRAVMRAIVVLIDIMWMKVRGTKVVWTRHDDGSHRQTHPRTERFFVRLYLRLTDAFIHLSEGSRRHFLSAADRRPQRVIPHGIGPIGAVDEEERSAAKKALDLNDQPVLGIVGRLQEYKNVVETIDAFAKLGEGQLLIAGEPIGQTYSESLESRQDTAGLRMKLGRLTEAEFNNCLAASDVVLLLYSNHLNSGVAFEALATPSKIAVTPSPSTAELSRQAGKEWVRLVSPPPTPRLLRELLNWAGQPTESAHELKDNWEQVAIETWAFLRSI
ncbi:MAG: glycosyltransferase [Acidimicrobiales bacterium]